MPLHDWTRVGAGEFHGFHMLWIASLTGKLNNGGLPDGYYCMPEQHNGPKVADILTLQSTRATVADGPAAIAVPAVSRRLVAPRKGRPRSIAVRRASDARVVALIEIVSAGNSDRPLNVRKFVEKVTGVLAAGINVLVVDILPPTKHAPRGLSQRAWRRLTRREFALPDETSRTVASFVAGDPSQVLLEHPRIGDELPAMPLYLTPDVFIATPLSASYAAAFHDLPKQVSHLVED